MEEVNKDEHEVIFDLLHNAAYQGTPLGRTILGPEENIKSIKRDDLVDFVKSNYHAPRIVVSASGAVKHDEIVRLSEQSFGNLPVSSIPQRPNVPFTGSLVSLRDDSIPGSHIAVAVESVGWSHPDYYTFLVIQSLIGAWDKNLGGGKNLSSHLCELIATEELATSYSTFHTCFHNTGMFGFYLVTSPEKNDDAVAECLYEWGRIAGTVTSVEVERAKIRLKANLLLNLDGSTSITEDIGRQVLTLGRRVSPAELFLRIDSITKEDVRRVAFKHLVDSEIAVAGLGSIVFLPDYNIMREWTTMKRF